LEEPQGALIVRTSNWMTRMIKDNASQYGFCRDSDACPPVVWMVAVGQHTDISPAGTMVGVTARKRSRFTLLRTDASCEYM
jgi:hypothetical protein